MSLVACQSKAAANYARKVPNRTAGGPRFAPLDSSLRAPPRSRRLGARWPTGLPARALRPRRRSTTPR